MRTRTLLVICCAVTLTSTALAGPPLPCDALNARLNANSNLYAMTHGDQIIAIYGITLHSEVNADVDQVVTNFLTNWTPSFCVENVSTVNDFVFKGKVTIKNGSMVVYTYQQLIDSTPVLGAGMRILVTLGNPAQSQPHKIGAVVKAALAEAKELVDLCNRNPEDFDTVRGRQSIESLIRRDLRPYLRLLRSGKFDRPGTGNQKHVALIAAMDAFLEDVKLQ